MRFLAGQIYGSWLVARRSLELSRIPVLIFVVVGVLGWPAIAAAQGDLATTFSSVAPDAPVAGQNAIYVFEVRNIHASEAASTVSVVTTIPSSLGFVSRDEPSGWTCSTLTVGASGDITCTIASLAAASSAVSFSTTVSVPSSATGNVTITAAASADPPDNPTTNNSASAVRTISRIADLEVASVTDSPDPVEAGNSVSYQINVSNNGPSDASNVQVAVTVPTGTTFDSGSGTGWGSCSEAGVTVTCQLSGNLAASATAGSLSVTFDVPSGASAGSISTTATVSSTVTDNVSENDSETESTTVSLSADLDVVSVTDTPDPVVAGNSVTYAVVVRNIGPSDASSVQVSIPVPAGTSFDSASGTGWSSCAEAGGTASCTLTSDLAASTTAEAVSFIFDVSESTVDGTELTATASVSSSVTDGVSGNNSDSATTTVASQADLSIKTFTAAPDPAVAGEQFAYTVVVTNDGPSEAADQTVSLPLPANTSYSSATGTGWSCSESSGTVTCVRSASLAADTDAPSLGIVVAVDSAAPPGTPLSTTASVSTTTTDPNSDNDSSSELSVGVEARVDLAVIAGDGVTSAVAGRTTLSYTVTVTNNGPSDVLGATLAGPLSDDLVAASWSCSTTPGTGTCRVAGGLGAVDALLDLETSAVATITLSAAVDDLAQGVACSSDTCVDSGTFTAAVPVSPNISDPISSNDSASDTNTVIDRQADLAVVKDDGVTSVAPNQVLNYSITVTNLGPSGAGGATLTDDFPSTLGDIGWTCASGTVLEPVDREVENQGEPVVNGIEGAAASLVTPDGAYVMVASASDNAVTVFRRTTTEGPTYGELTWLRSVGNLDEANALATDRQGAFLYVTAPGQNQLRVFSINSGTGELTAVQTVTDGDSGVDGLSSGSAVVVSPDDRHVYVAGSGDDAIAVFSRNTGTGLLTFEETVTHSLLQAPSGLAFSPNGANLYVASADNNTVVYFDRNRDPSDGSFGDLSNLQTASGPAGLESVAVSPDGDSVAAVGSTTGTLMNWDRGADGGLSNPQTLEDGSGGIGSMAGAGAVAFSPDGELVVVAADTDDALVVFSRAASGVLTFLEEFDDAATGGFQSLDGASHVAFSPEGDHFVATAAADNAVNTFAASPGSSCSMASGAGDITAQQITVPAGGSIRFQATATVSPGVGDQVCNTAEIAVPAGVTDPEEGNDSSEDCDPVLLQSDVVVTVDDSTISATPGEDHSFVIVTRNDGVNVVNAASVTSDAPISSGGSAGFESGSVEWSCVASGGACCESGTSECGSVADPVTGSGNLAQSVDLPPGGSVEITMSGHLDPSATGSLLFAAAATLNGTVADPNLDNNTDTDDTVLEPSADLEILKTGQLVGNTASYTIRVNNFVGPSDATGVGVQDTPPAGLQNLSWSCTTSGGATCVSGQQTGTLTDIVNLPLGSEIVYSLTADVGPGAEPVLINTAGLTAAGDSDPNTANNTDQAALTLRATGDLSVFVSDGVATAIAGEALSYTLSVSNAGPDDVVGATVQDLFPIGLRNVRWTCSATPPIPGDLDLLESQVLQGARTVTVSPDGTHVYAAGDGPDGTGRIIVFTREASAGPNYGRLGVLQVLDGNDIGVPLDGVSALALSPDGRSLYAVSAVDNALIAFFRDWAMGSPTFGEIGLVNTLDYVAGPPAERLGLDGGSAVTVSPDGGQVYVTGLDGDAVSVFERNPASGSVTWIEDEIDGVDDGGDDGEAVDGLDGPRAVLVSPDGAHLYVASANDDAVAIFERDGDDGRLSFSVVVQNGSNGPAGASALAMDSLGDHLYVAGPDDDAIVTFLRNPDTGMLGTPTTITSAQPLLGWLTGVTGLALSPDGQHLFGLSPAGGVLGVLRRNPGTGILTQETELNLVDGADGVDGLAGVVTASFSPNGEHVYAASEADGIVLSIMRRQPDPGYAFIESEVEGVNDPDDAGVAVSGLEGARAVAVSPDGAHLYAVSLEDDAVVVFSRDPEYSSTSSTPGAHLSFVQTLFDGEGGVDGLAGPSDVVVSPDNAHVYVTSEGEGAVSVFERDPSTGRLTFLQVLRDGEAGVNGIAGALGLAMTPAGDQVFVAGQYDAAVAVFDRDTALASPSFGRLTLRSLVANGVGSTEGLTGVAAVGVSADGRHVYAVSRVDDALVVFSHEPGGDLGFLQALYDGGDGEGLDQAMDVVVSRDGPGGTESSHVYTVGINDDAVSVFRRETDPESDLWGQLTFLQTIADGDVGADYLDGARSLAMGNDGRQVYVVSEFDAALTVLDRVVDGMSPDYGLLTAVESRVDDQGIDGLRQAYGVAVSPDSRNVYTASLGEDAILAFVRRSGSSCTASGVGNIMDSVALGFGGTVTYTVTATIDPAAFGPLTNQATVSAPEEVTDPVEANDSSVDLTNIVAEADVSVSKTDNRTNAVVGEEVVYEITIRNSGPSNAVGVRVEDSALGGDDFSQVDWSCIARGSGSLLEVDAFASSDLAGASSVAVFGNHVYATGLLADSLAVFEVDPLVGSLEFVEVHLDGEGPVDGLEGAVDVAVSPAGDEVYVVSRLDDAVAVFERDGTTGALTFLEAHFDNSGPVDGLDQASAVVVDPGGNHVYVAGANDAAVAIFERQVDGGLSFDAVVAPGGLTGVTALAFDPMGASLYAAAFNASAVTLLDRDSETGGLSFVESKIEPALERVRAVAVSPDGRHLVAAGATAAVVFDRNPENGTLVRIQTVEDGVDADGMAGARSVVFSPDPDGGGPLPAGDHVYIAGTDDDAISMLRRNADGTLSYVGLAADSDAGEHLNGVSDIAFLAGGVWAVTSALQDSAVALFERSVDSSCPVSGSGPISELVNVAAGGSVQFMVTAGVDDDASGEPCSTKASSQVCLVNDVTIAGEGGIYTDPVAGNNNAQDSDILGRLADLAISKTDQRAQFDGLSGPMDVVVTPATTGTHVYTAAASDNGVGIFARETDLGEGFGTLTYVDVVRDGVEGVDGLSGVSALAADGAGAQIYAAGTADASVVAFSRDAGTGELTILDHERNGEDGVEGLLGVADIELSPAGRHLYAAGTDADSIAIFRRETGATEEDFGHLEFLGSVTNSEEGVEYLLRPSSIAISPDGSHVIAASPSGDAVVVFDRETDSESAGHGLLSFNAAFVDGDDGSNGLEGVVDVVITQDGAHVYTVSASESALVVLARNVETGELAFLESYRDGENDIDGLAGARRLAISPDGAHLLVTGESEDAVTVFTRDADPDSGDFGLLSALQIVRDGDVQTGPGGPIAVQRLDAPTPVTVTGDGLQVLVGSRGDESLTLFVRQANPDEDEFGALAFQGFLVDGGGGAPPGSDLDYLIRVWNNGPSQVTDARVEDFFPSDFQSVRWTCRTSAGATCVGSGEGDIDQLVDLPVDGWVEFTAGGPLRADRSGILTNTATVTAPNGVTDPVIENNSATDADTVLARVAELEVTKDNGLSELSPGEPVTWQILVRNHGPSMAEGVVVTDQVPEMVSNVTWTCTADPLPGFPAFLEVEQDGVDEPSDTGGPVFGLAGVRFVALSSDRRHLYSAAPDDASVAVFSRDGTSGRLRFETAIADGDTQEQDEGPDLTVDGLAGAIDLVLSPDGGHLYALGETDDAVAVFRRDASSGDLTWVTRYRDGLGGFDALGRPNSAVIHGDGRHVYVAASADDAISLLERDPATGLLTLLNVTREGVDGVSGIAGVSSLSMMPDGSGLVAASPSSNTVVVFERNAASGLLEQAQVLENGAGGIGADDLLGPAAVAVDAGRDRLYVACAAGDTVTVFDRDPETDLFVVAQIVQNDEDGFSGLAGPAGLELTGSGSQLIVVGEASDSVVILGIDENDRLVPNAVITDGDAAGEVTIDGLDGATALASEGSLLYVAGATDSAITTFNLALGSSCISSGQGHLDEIIDLSPGGSVIFNVTGVVAASATGVLSNMVVVTAPDDLVDPGLLPNSAMDEDPLTGAANLTLEVEAIPTTVQAGQPVVLRMTVRNTGPSDAFGAILESTPVVAPADQLGPHDPAALVTGTGAVVCAADATLEYLEAAVEGGEIGSPPQTVDGLEGTEYVAVSPDGLAVYATGMAEDSVVVLARDPDVGSLSLVETVRDGDVHGEETVDGLVEPAGVAVSPDGSHVVVAASGSASLLVFERSATDGSLSMMQVVTDGFEVDGLVGATGVAFSPDGRSVVVASAEAGALVVFDRDSETGHLVFLERHREGLGGVPLLTLDGARSVVVTPDGRTVAVAAQGADALTLFDRDPDSGLLTFRSVVRNGDPPPEGGSQPVNGLDFVRSVASSPNGDFFYVTSLVEDSVAVLSHDTDSGAVAFVTSYRDGVGGVTGLNGATHAVASADGSYLYVAGLNADRVAAFKRDWLTGELDFVGAVSGGHQLDGPAAIAASADGRSLYVAARVSGSVAVFDRTPEGWCQSGTGGTSDVVDEVFDLSVGATMVFTLEGVVHPGARGFLNFDVNLTTQTGLVEETLNLPVGAVSAVSVNKTDGLDTAVAGQTLAWTITVANAGPAHALDTVVVDTLPAALLDATWVCEAAPGSSCAEEGVGDILDNPQVAASGQVTYTVTGIVDSAVRGTISNTASASTSTDDDPADNISTDEDVVVAISDLSAIVSSDGETAVPGTDLIYTIQVANAGPSDAAAVVRDTFPPILDPVDWTCVGAGGASCSASGTGHLNESLTLPAGSTAVFTVVGRIDPFALGEVINSVATEPTDGAADPVAENNSDSESDLLTPQADLSVVKDDGMGGGTVVTGTGLTYLIEVRNETGPSAAHAVAVTETLPAGVTAVATSGCAEDAGGGIGLPICTLGDLGPGSTSSYTVEITVDEGTLGDLVNQVVTATQSDDQNSDNDSASVTTVAEPWTDLSVSKTDGTDPAVAGTEISYTVSVTNPGPYDAEEVVVRETLPAGVTAVATSGCAEDGTVGVPDCTLGTIASGAQASYTVTVATDPDLLGPITNQVDVNSRWVDPVTEDNRAFEETEMIAEADIAVEKSNGRQTVMPGRVITWEITVSNLGPSDAPAVDVTDDDLDNLPILGVLWTCEAQNGGFCTPGPVSGDILDRALLPLGASVVYTVGATLDPAVDPEVTPQLVNTAFAAVVDPTVDPNGANNSATDTDLVGGPPIFSDGFESGDMQAWSSMVDGQTKASDEGAESGMAVDD